MTPVEIFMARGADSVGGDLILRNKSMGTTRNGVFVISADGEAELAIEEAVVKTPAKAAKTKIKIENPVAEPAADDVAAGLDALLS